MFFKTKGKLETQHSLFLPFFFTINYFIMCLSIVELNPMTEKQNVISNIYYFSIKMFWFVKVLT